MARADLLGPGDVIEVRVAEEPSLGGEFAVAESGMLDFGAVGQLQVAGLTAEQAADRIRALLERRALLQATVTVQVVERDLRPVQLVGAIRKPGPLEVPRGLTLLEAITAAGGLTQNHGDTIYVRRLADNGLSDQVAISVRELMVEANARVNLPLFPGDLINVPEAVGVTIFLLGEFAARGAQQFMSNERITLLSVIARAGGLTNRASKKIVIKRQDEQGMVHETVVDYKAILAGKTADVELRPDDILLARKAFL